MREYWTETRQGLVIEGNPETIRQIARSLEISATVPIQVSNSRCVLGLWGESVRAYQELPTNASHPGEFVSAG